MRWTRGAQVNGLGAVAGPLPAARPPQAHGPVNQATCTAPSVGSRQDLSEYQAQSRQPRLSAWTSDAVTRPIACTNGFALLPRCVLSYLSRVLQPFTQHEARRVPNMSAPDDSHNQEGKKAKREFPRSYFRADGTRRRTAGEKQARKDWNQRRDTRHQPKSSPSSGIQQQWRKKDTAQVMNEGWGANLHQSGTSAESWQQQDPRSSEPDRWDFSSRPEPEHASAPAASPAPAPPTAADSPKCPLLLIRLPDCSGISELARQLESIKQTSGLGQLLLSSRPKEGRWTLMLEGTQECQDKAKAIVKDLLERTQCAAPKARGSEIAGYATMGAGPGPSLAQAPDAGRSAEAPCALPLVVLPSHPSTRGSTLDGSPSEAAVTTQQTCPEGAEEIVQSGVRESQTDSASHAYRVAPSAVLPAPDFTSVASCQPDSERSQGRGRSRSPRGAPRPAQPTAQPSHQLSHPAVQAFCQQIGSSLREQPQLRNVRDAILSEAWCRCDRLPGQPLEHPDFSRRGRAKGWATFRYKRTRRTSRGKAGPLHQCQVAGRGQSRPFPLQNGLIDRAARAFLSSPHVALHRSLLLLLFYILLASPREPSRSPRSRRHSAVGLNGVDAQVPHVHTTANNNRHELSCPGPKPGDDSSSKPRHRHQDIRWQRSMLYWIIIVFQMQLAWGVGESRVETSTSGVSGTGFSLPGQRTSTREDAGAATQTTARPSGALVYPWSAKRAYRRARARAAHGPTMYRGSLCSASDLQAQYGQPLPPPNHKPTPTARRGSRDRPQTRARHPARRVQVLTFNVSGLSSAMWQELQTWLSTPEANNYDIILLQETHWTSVSDFTSGQWRCVGTPIADKDKCSGLLTLVHSRLGPAHVIQSKTYLKGRVLHTRVHQQFGAIDVINVYQHVWCSQHTAAQNQAARTSVYRAIRLALAECPMRHTCILGGDFNTAVKELTPHIGKALLTGKGPSGEQDGDEGLPELLQTFGLSLLNTWHGKHKATNLTSGTRSQIDFIAMRVQWADRLAKQSDALSACPVGAWKANRHFPVRASIKLVSPWHLIRQPKSAQASLNKAEMQVSIAKQDDRAQQLRLKIEQDLLQIPTTQDLGELTKIADEILLQRAAQIYPARPRKDERVSQNPLFTTRARELWRLYRAYRSVGRCTQQNVLGKWRLWAQFRKASKLMRDSAKLVKRQRVKDIMTELEQAAQSGDQGGTYAAVRKLAPWKPAMKPNIRGASGELLTPAQQLQALTSHAEEKFCQGADFIPTGTLREGIRVTSTQIQHALRRLPIRKAAPPTAAPSALWKNSAHALADLFHEQIAHMWRTGQTGRAPPIWKDASMVWMPKPNKDCSLLANLRPIGLVHPMGKSVCVLLRSRLRPLLTQALITRPQFAYAKGRSTLDALLRAHGHLAQTRQEIEKHRTSLYARHSGEEPKTCFGGLCFSLDLKGAFDAVPRPRLAESLFRLQVEPDLVHLIMQMQYQAQYWTQIGADNRPVTPTQGIKQGCNIAPYLFVAYTIMLIDRISESTSTQWTNDGLTWYADDAFAAWMIQGTAALRQALGELRTIIMVLKEHGMDIQADKCAVLINLHGKDVNKVMKHVKVRRNDQAYLQVQAHSEVQIPIKKQHEYLGTILAYRDPQTLTLSHRLSKARGQYALLRKTLHARRLISSKHRYRIWKAGVQASACYGLAATGLTVTGRTQLLAMAARQLRSLAGRPAHLTHESNAEIRQRFGCAELTEDLRKLASNRLAELRELRQLQPENIVTRSIATSQLESAIATFQKVVPVEHPKQDGVKGVGVPCPVCGVYHTNRTSMKKHLAVKHPEYQPPTIQFDPATHAVGGLPQCAACLHKFQSWIALRTHIERGNCAHLGSTTLQNHMERGRCAHLDSITQEPTSGPAHADMSPQDPPPPGAETFSAGVRLPPHRNKMVAQLIREHGWEALTTSAHAADLRQHCCLCARWIVDPTALKRHIAQSHKELWARVSGQIDSTCAVFKTRLTRDGTCPYCHRTSYNRHFKQCCVIFQSALLGLLPSHDDSNHRSDSDVRVPPARTERDTQTTPGDTAGEEHGRGRIGPAGEEAKNPSGGTGEPSLGPRQGPHTGREQAHVSDLTHLDSARGQHQRGQDGSRLHGLHGPNGPGRPAHQSVPGKSCMEQGAGDRAEEDHTAAANYAAGPDDCRADCTPTKLRQHAGSQEVGDDRGPARSARKTPVPKVGRGKQKAAPESNDARTPNQGRDADPQGDGAAHPGGLRATIPRPTKDQTDAGNRKQSGLQARDIAQAPPSQHALPEHGKVGGQRGLAAYWLPNQKGRHAAIQPDPGADEDDQSGRPAATSAQKLILRAVLQNNSNTCYLNAFLHTLLWQVTAQSEVALPKAWQEALEKVRLKPLALLRFHLLGWAQPHVQHDVAELATLLLRNLGWVPCALSWCRRVQVEGGFRNLQTMQDARLLHLDPDQGLHTSVLQDIIKSWHGIIAVQALHSAPAMIWIQLPRFVCQDGRVQKVKQRLRLGTSHRRIHLPVFSSSRDTSISWHEYQVNAVIYHIGPSVNEGHYRAMLFHPQVEGGWHTEDAQQAVWSATVPTQVEINCYLLCATRFVGL